MNWISVKDKLPEHHDIVLTIVKDKNMAVTFFVKGKIVAASLRSVGKEATDPEDLFCSLERPGMVLYLKDVTHWMPLPEPPK